MQPADISATTAAPDSSRPSAPGHGSPRRAWPRWAMLVVAVALMLGWTLLAMWAGSLSDALGHVRATMIGAVAPAEPIVTINGRRSLTLTRNTGRHADDPW
jgi:hypothetical protein